jgi:transposase
MREDDARFGSFAVFRRASMMSAPEADNSRITSVKQCRRIATRYDKLAANYLAFVKLASIRIWPRAKESAR